MGIGTRFGHSSQKLNIWRAKNLGEILEQPSEDESSIFNVRHLALTVDQLLKYIE